MKHFPKLSAHYAKKRSSSVLRNKYYVVFALPFCVTETLVVLHGVYLGLFALVGSQPHSHGGLHYKSNSESLPGRAGGSPMGSIECNRGYFLEVVKCIMGISPIFCGLNGLVNGSGGTTKHFVYKCFWVSLLL